MTIRYPAPLRPGDRIGVTAPSAGVSERFAARLEFCVEDLEQRGFEVVLGACLDGDGPVSAPAEARAAELTAMLVDPAIRAVVPPWGGELAIDLLEHLDWAGIAAAEPTWFVGYSDIATLLVPLTLLTGIATVHGQNLMDTPFTVPPEQRSWLDVARLPHGSSLTQRPAPLVRSAAFEDIAADPTRDTFTLDTPGTWSRLDALGDVEVTGRLIGGCLETLSDLGGTRYGDVPAFARTHAPEGLLIYVEAAEGTAFDIARRLHGMRLAGWFDDANAILVGRTHAPDAPGFSQRDAVLDALAPLGVPIVADVECGHVAPHMALVNGAVATLRWSPDERSLTQTLS